jgi:alpha-beta hydrolase superfamily lysophospholipase
MVLDAMTPVATKTTSIQPRIRKSLPVVAMPATDDEITKNTSGTTAANRAFRKTSPNGLSTVAFSLKRIPMAEPTATAPIRTSDIP